MKKLLFRLFIGGIILILMLNIGLFLFFRLAWKNYYSSNEVKKMVSLIKSAPKLSDSLYLLYDNIYKDRHETFTTHYIKSFGADCLSRHSPVQNNWQYTAANLQVYKGNYYKVAPITLAFRLGEEISPEKCFDYVMAGRYKFYCKTFKISDTVLANLIDRDPIIKFIIASERPDYYRTHARRYQFEVDSVGKILWSQKEINH